MDSSWEWLSACHSAVGCQGETAVLLGSMCPPVPSQAWWCPVGHPRLSPRGLGDAMMARGATWGPWPPPHAHGSAQQQCLSAQAGPSKGLGQPMTPKAHHCWLEALSPRPCHMMQRAAILCQREQEGRSRRAREIAGVSFNLNSYWHSHSGHESTCRDGAEVQRAAVLQALPSAVPATLHVMLQKRFGYSSS